MTMIKVEKDRGSKRTLVPEDIKQILDQIDKILEIHTMLIKEFSRPFYIVDTQVDFKSKNEILKDS